eukprot:5416768-Pleurochrysis_carterae.AAC.3
MQPSTQDGKRCPAATIGEINDDIPNSVCWSDDFDERYEAALRRVFQSHAPRPTKPCRMPRGGSRRSHLAPH